MRGLFSVGRKGISLWSRMRANRLMCVVRLTARRCIQAKVCEERVCVCIEIKWYVYMYICAYIPLQAVRIGILNGQAMPKPPFWPPKRPCIFVFGIVAFRSSSAMSPLTVSPHARLSQTTNACCRCLHRRLVVAEAIALAICTGPCMFRPPGPQFGTLGPQPAWPFEARATLTPVGPRQAFPPPRAPTSVTLKPPSQCDP